MNNKLDDDFFYRAHTMDGAFGTLAIKRGGLSAGVASESLNFTHPQLVESIHRDYAAAGADIICANTFGANPLKNPDYKQTIRRALSLARKAAPHCAVALDVGPCGRVIGEGGMDFFTCVEGYEKYYLACEDYDFVMIETMTDLCELRAALIAAQNTGKTAICSMSFEENGRTFFGCDIESFAVCARALGAKAVGINCSLGAVKVKPLAKKLQAVCELPVYIKPNAGIPQICGGTTVYNETAEQFYGAMKEIASYGIAMLGGCCGSDESYIRLISGIERECRTGESAAGKLCSAFSCVTCGKGTLTVGERINPTGKPRLKQALREGDYDYLVALALQQAQSGAALLDVNVGLGDIDETAAMRRAVSKLKSVGLPLVIDTSSAAALERALAVYDGKALINSVNGTKESLNAVLPLAKKYGAAVIGLCLDESGIPPDAQKRVAIAEKIIARAMSYGLDRRDIYIDTLTMAEGAGRGNALAALDALKAVGGMGVNTVLGISNISFGMPDREDINAAFYEMCADAGLTLAIINPSLTARKGSDAARDFLSGRQGAAEKYISVKNDAANNDNRQESATSQNRAQEGTQNSAGAQPLDLKQAVVDGLSNYAAAACKELLKTLPPMAVAERYIIPALDEVSERYENGTFYLPQLIAAADAAKSALELITAALPISDSDTRQRFVICTVKGDVHDIGKNIVKAVVSNYGYQVIDLGRDVDAKTVLRAVDEHYPCVLGLSALMTTTAVNMADTIALVRGKYPDLEILVGGAVLSEEFARKIGGLYCRDAGDTVKRLKQCTFGM